MGVDRRAFYLVSDEERAERERSWAKRECRWLMESAYWSNWCNDVVYARGRMIKAAEIYFGDVDGQG